MFALKRLAAPVRMPLYQVPQAAIARIRCHRLCYTTIRRAIEATATTGGRWVGRVLYWRRYTSAQRSLHNGTSPTRAAHSTKATPRHLTAVQCNALPSGGHCVAVEWNTGNKAQPALFHASWLRHNCAHSREKFSGQKTITHTLLHPATCVPIEAWISEDNSTMNVKWGPDGHVSTFTADWLSAHAGVSAETPLPIPSVPDQHAPISMQTEEGSGTTLVALDYHEVISSEEGLWQWLEAMRRDGMCLLRGAPTHKGPAVELANLYCERYPGRMY